MNAMNVVEMNQVVGKLFHALSDTLTEAVLGEVFVQNGAARLHIHDLELELEGYNQICTVLQRPKYRKYFHGMFHMLHSNAYEERDGRVFGHWNAHSFLPGDADENGGNMGAAGRGMCQRQSGG